MLAHFVGRFFISVFFVMLASNGLFLELEIMITVIIAW